MKNYKKDFPIFMNNPSLVYLDSAATSQKPQIVINAITNFYDTYNSNIHRGIYPIAERATDAIERVRKEISSFLNAKSAKEIVFTHGTTEGINIVSNGLKKIVKKNETILLTEMEHHSNLVPWQKLARESEARLEYLSVDSNGLLSDPDFSSFTNVKIFAISHVSNVLGTINPIKMMIRKVKKMFPDVIVLIDAAQSVAHMQIDVADLNCDFLVFSGHKVFGPSGVGILYGKENALEQLEPFIVGSQMIRDVKRNISTWTDVPYRFEAGTISLEGVIGLGVAVQFINSIGYDAIHKHEEVLLKEGLNQLSTIEELTIYGPENSKERSGSISFTSKNIHPHDIAQILGEQNICIRAGHHCAIPLHAKLGIAASCRVSFSIYNTKRDVEALVKGLQKVKKIFQ